MKSRYLWRSHQHRQDAEGHDQHPAVGQRKRLEQEGGHFILSIPLQDEYRYHVQHYAHEAEQTDYNGAEKKLEAKWK